MVSMLQRVHDNGLEAIVPNKIVWYAFSMSSSHIISDHDTHDQAQV